MATFSFPSQSEKTQSNEEAEVIVRRWAANINRCLSKAELKCLTNYLKSSCKARADDFDKVLFGWNMRGEDETKDVADAIQSLVNSNKESIEKLLSGFEDTQNRFVSLVEKAMENTSVAAAKPSPSNPRKWPVSLLPSEDECRVLSSRLRSGTFEESLKIYDIFEELIVIQKLKGERLDLMLDKYDGEITLDDFLRLYHMTIEEFIPFTPPGKTTEVMRKFVVALQDGRKFFPGVRNRLDLTAKLSVYLSEFNEGK